MPPKTPPEAAKLYEIVGMVVDKRRDQSRINPAWIATEACNKIDPQSITRKEFSLMYIAAHLQLRQIARSVLRSKFEPNEESEPVVVHDLFPDLQPYYPAARSKGDEDPEYVRLEDTTDEDLDYNIDRLRSEATAKLAHADALQAYKRERKAKRVPGARADRVPA